MIRYLNRKTFVKTLGVAGLGLGLLASAAGAPSAMAQEEDPKDVLVQLLQDAEGEGALQDAELKDVLIALLQEEATASALGDDKARTDIVFQRLQGEDDNVTITGPAEFGEKRAELYAEFTAALANELGIADADEVDAAIRIAMMSVVDGRVEEGLLTEGQAEAVKFLIATSDVPLPAMGHGGGPGRMFIAAHGPAFGPEGHMFPGKATTRERIFEKARDARSETSDEKDERGARAGQDGDTSDSQADEDEQG